VAPAARSVPSAGSATATPEIMNGGANCDAAIAGTRRGCVLVRLMGSDPDFHSSGMPASRTSLRHSAKQIGQLPAIRDVYMASMSLKNVRGPRRIKPIVDTPLNYGPALLSYGYHSPFGFRSKGARPLRGPLLFLEG